MNTEKEQKVAEMFKDNGKISSFLQLQNNLDDVRYDYNDNRPEGADKVYQDDLEKYCFEHHRKMLPSECEKMRSLQSFKTKMKITQESRYKAGVIASTNKKELLAIKIKDNKGNINQLDFPKGKEDCSDKKFMKATAFREFGEETGVWVSDDDYKKCNKFRDIKKPSFPVKYQPNEPVRYYLFNNLDEKLVNLNHKLRDEVYGLKWVTKEFYNSASEFTTTQRFDRAFKMVALGSKGLYLPPGSTENEQTEDDTSIGLKEYQQARKKHLEKQNKLAKEKTNKDNEK